MQIRVEMYTYFSANKKLDLPQRRILNIYCILKKKLVKVDSKFFKLFLDPKGLVIEIGV